MLAAEVQKSSWIFEEKDSRSRKRDYICNPFSQIFLSCYHPNLPPDTKEGQARCRNISFLFTKHKYTVYL